MIRRPRKEIEYGWRDAIHAGNNGDVAASVVQSQHRLGRAMCMDSAREIGVIASCLPPHERDWYF
jgi:hypothetical protein